MTATTRAPTWTDRIDDLAQAHADDPALVVAGEIRQALSWRDLAERSAAVSRLFTERGVSAGQVVAVSLPNGAAHVLATIGAWRLGATILPLRWDLPASERDRILELAQPVLTVGPTEAGASIGAEAVLSASPLAPAMLTPAPVASPAWLVASGGSTGAPKLIALTNSTAFNQSGAPMAGSARSAGLNSPGTQLICSPLYHTLGLALLYNRLLSGMRVVVMPYFEAEAFLDVVEQERITSVGLVPTMAIRLLRSPTIRSRDLSSLSYVSIGAGATPPWAVRELIELIGPDRLFIGYGMSESLVSVLISGTEWLQHPGSVGKPRGVETLVADENGRSLAPGEVGELYFRRADAGVPFKYLGDASPRRLPGGWTSVGDLGRVDEEGYLYIVDRRTDMIVTGGANVFVNEVEAALLAHPEVADAVVIGLADPDWGRRVHAVVELRPGAAPQGAEARLREYGKQTLAAYKVPRSFDFVARIERNDAGKLDRQALVRERELAETAAR